MNSVPPYHTLMLPLLNVMGSRNVSFFNKRVWRLKETNLKQESIIYDPLEWEATPSQTAEVLSAKNKIEEGSNGRRQTSPKILANHSAAHDWLS